jgi:DHA3 family macrolide efflux protein-like MFS transporter
VLTALRVPGFRWLWTGQLLSQFGNAVFLIMGLWEIQLKNPLLLSVAGLAMMLPQVLAAVGGIVVDRFDGRRLMLWTDILRGTAMILGLLLLTVTPAWRIWIIIALLAVNALGNALFGPAENTVLPTLVAPADLPSANGLYSLTFQLSSAVGSAIGGAAIAAVGVTLVFGFDMGSFWFSALAILLMMRVTAAPPGANRGALSGAEEHVGFRAGWKVLSGFRWLVILLPIVVLANFSGNGAFLLLPYWVHHHLHASVAWYGLTEGAWAFGTVAGSLSAGSLGRFPIRRVVGFSGIVQAGLLGAFALITGTTAAAVVFFFAGIANGLVNALLFTMMQRAIPAAVRGRAFGLLMSVLSAANPLAATVAGLSVHVLPVFWWYVGSAVTGGALGVGLWTLIPDESAIELADSAAGSAVQPGPG